MSDARRLVILAALLTIALVSLSVHSSTMGWRALWRDPLTRCAIVVGVLALFCAGAA